MTDEFVDWPEDREFPVVAYRDTAWMMAYEGETATYMVELSDELPHINPIRSVLRYKRCRPNETVPNDVHFYVVTAFLVE